MRPDPRFQGQTEEPGNLLGSTPSPATAPCTLRACTAALPLAEAAWNIEGRPQPPAHRCYWRRRPRCGSACRSHTQRNTGHRETPARAVCGWSASNGRGGGVTCPQGPVYHSTRSRQGPESQGATSAGRSPSQPPSGRSLS